MLMKRLYFMVPDTEACKAIVTDLRSAAISKRHLHVVASPAVALGDLPEATLAQKTELAHGIEKGIFLGGIAGLLGGVLIVAFPPTGMVVSGPVSLAAVTAGSAAFGALAMGLISKDIHNRKLAAFERDIEAGRILLMVDVPRHDVERWKAFIVERHPEAEIGVSAVPAT